MTLKQFVRRAMPLAVKKYLYRRRPLLPPTGLSWALCRLELQPKVIFDIGANIGEVTCEMLDFFPAVTVYAFEPAATTFRLLEGNTRQFGERVQRHQIGFSQQSEHAWLNTTTFHGTNSLLPISDDFARIAPHIQGTGKEQIRLVCLDDFVQQQKISHIDLVKIDVEGWERQVLLGGKYAFSSIVDIVLLEISLARHGFGSDEYVELLRLMHDYGFDLIAFHDIAYHCSAEYGIRLFQIDAVFVRRGKVLFA